MVYTHTHSIGMNLTREPIDLYTENFKTLKKMIEDDSRRWADLPCSFLKAASLPKSTRRFNAVHI